MGWKEIPVITAAQLGEFHKAKGVKNASCLRCGSVNWILMSSPDAPISAVPTATTDERANVDLFTAVLTLSCANCGTLWSISASHIEQWLDEKSSNGANDGGH